MQDGSADGRRRLHKGIGMKQESFSPNSPHQSRAACPSDHAARANEVVAALVANELDAVRNALEDIGMHLCSDMAILQQYGELLQGLDELAQRNENLARLLRSSAMEPAIDAISLESLRNRLLNGVAQYLAQYPDDPMAGAQGDWVPV